jgi:DNA-binding transcriptional LysR family regulator
LQDSRAYPSSPPARHLISQPRVALDYILSNGGCAYLPRQLVLPYIAENKLFLVEEAPIFNREIFALYLEKSHKDALITKALHYFPEILFS